MSSGLPRSVSGGSSSFRTARTKQRAEMMRDAARVTWLFRAGVGSSSRRKKGLRFKTTGLSKFRKESYPVMFCKSKTLYARQAERWRHTELFYIARLSSGILLESCLQL